VIIVPYIVYTNINKFQSFKKQKSPETNQVTIFNIMVREAGFEPAQPCDR
jgi:hypothetical protein